MANQDRDRAGAEFARRPPRGGEPVFNIPTIVLAVIGICVAVYLLQAHVLSAAQNVRLVVAAAFVPVRYSGQYVLDWPAFTSPVTYSLLHGGVAHLAINMIWLAAFGSPLANRIGPARFVVFWCFTAIAAALLHYALHPLSEAPLVGASGAISGMMGAAARYGFRIDRTQGRPLFTGLLLPIGDVLRSRMVVAFLAVWFVINIATGLAGMAPDGVSAIAWEAHIGGFLAGFMAIRAFDRRRG